MEGSRVGETNQVARTCPQRIKAAVEIIKFEEMRDPAFQSGLILLSRRYSLDVIIRPRLYVLTRQADHVSPSSRLIC